jgi:hypothetical protein
MLKPKTEFFNPAKTVYVLRAFKAMGRNFVQGDAFDWVRLSIDKRRVGQLFLSRQLCHADALPASKTVYNPAQALLELGFTPELIASEFDGELIKKIHGTTSREGLNILLDTHTKKEKVKARGSK